MLLLVPHIFSRKTERMAREVGGEGAVIDERMLLRCQSLAPVEHLAVTLLTARIQACTASSEALSAWWTQTTPEVRESWNASRLLPYHVTGHIELRSDEEEGAGPAIAASAVDRPDAPPPNGLQWLAALLTTTQPFPNGIPSRKFVFELMCFVNPNVSLKDVSVDKYTSGKATWSDWPAGGKALLDHLDDFLAARQLRSLFVQRVLLVPSARFGQDSARVMEAFNGEVMTIELMRKLTVPLWQLVPRSLRTKTFRVPQGLPRSFN